MALNETRKELKKQCFLGTALFLIAYLIPYDSGVSAHRMVFWSILIVIILTGLLLIYAARRGVWVCWYRAMILFTGLGAGSVVGLYIALGQSDKFQPNGPDLDPVAVGTILAMVALAVIPYYFLWIRPYWRNTYDLNVQRKKIDLDNGTYSVTTRWAIRGTKPGATGALISAGVPFAAGLGVLLVRSEEPQFLVLLVPALLLLWLAASMSLIEIYNGVQLRRIEKQIGRPLIIDAYV